MTLISAGYSWVLGETAYDFERHPEILDLRAVLAHCTKNG